MSFPENNQSAIDAMALLKANVPPTAGGESGDAAGLVDDEPTCMQIVTRCSLQGAKNGDPSPVWMRGRPSRVGISEKHTACTPRAALRRTSSAASAASH